MKDTKVFITASAVLLAVAIFIGCGERAGEKEYEKAVAAWKKGDLVRARTLFEKSIRKTSGNEKKSVAWNQLGLVLWQLGETESAANAFGNSCNLTEAFTGANLNHGIALFHAGKLAEAEVALNNVVGDNPKNQTALAMLGMIEMKKRDWAGASQELSKTVAADPRNPAGQNALALVELHRNRNSNAAITRLKQLLAAHSNYAPAAYNLGVIYDQWLGNKSAAQGWYSQYLKIAEADGSHVDAAKKALERLGGKTTAATPSATQADPVAAARFIAEGSRLYQAGKFDEAAAQYLKATEADPGQKNTHYNLGLAYYAVKKYPEAADACINALKIDPQFADARYMLSLSYFQLRNWNEAEREAKALQQVDAKRGGEMLNHISNARKR